MEVYLNKFFQSNKRYKNKKEYQTLLLLNNND